jgi:superfamily I DNA and RNA helicase
VTVEAGRELGSYVSVRGERLRVEVLDRTDRGALLIDIVRGVMTKPAATSKIDRFFRSVQMHGMLFLGYPLTGVGQAVDALLACPELGVVAFDLVEGGSPEDRSERRDELHNLLYSGLLRNRQLTEARKLAVPVNVATFAPGWARSEDAASLVSDEALKKYLDRLPRWEAPALFTALLSVLQVATRIKAPYNRNIIKEDSKGAKISQIEASIATLDREQAKAVIETCDGLQRIRGLAGSGKTIVLAMKAAYLHSIYPTWRIGITFHTRSLKQQFQRLISRFTIEQIQSEPDWNNVRILQSWGSPNSPGIYYEICSSHGVKYYDYRRAKTEGTGDVFDFVCAQALADVKDYRPQYDVLLVDEAQDLPMSFLKLCYNFVKEPRRMVVAYDELQKLNEIAAIDLEVLMGKGFRLVNEEGRPKQDIILDRCYRNSRPLLATAHALGFGIYRDGGLVQMFKEPMLWKDVGYNARNGALEVGKYVELVRTAETSPLFLEEIDQLQQLVSCVSFQSFRDECEWVANAIEHNLKEEELSYRDVLVIYADAIYAEKKLGEFRDCLLAKGINSHTVGISTSPDEFLQENSVACTGIFRAKGNEAAFVYVLDAHLCFGGYNLRRKRNILFTAITRSKGWVRLCGYSDEMAKLTEEVKRVQDREFALCFTYPDEATLMEMAIVYREMSYEETKKAKKSTDDIKTVLELLDAGAIRKEDIPEGLRKRLLDYLSK